jgi:hypothetical protein
MDQNRQSRINTLKQIKQRIDDMIADVNAGRRTLKSIPFIKTDIDKFLPAASNLNSAIPQLINDSGSNTALNSLFPNYAAGDVKGADLAKDVFAKYADDFFKNMSWDITVKHKGAGEREIAKNYASAMMDAKSMAADANMAGSGTHGPAPAGEKSSYGGFLDSIVKAMGSSMDTGDNVTGGSMVSTATGETGSTTKKMGMPAKFDWKQRSVQICAQISARGMDPNDFGCLANPDSMRQESFSWRGHTRMVCNRLNTVYDTSIPFLCGCPPPTWPGWRQ